ncbi:MAG: hypothetical protein KF744_17255 [Taibaiella sp.]|nr:hypothetical protein [Taibaiella sp.]
MTTIYQMNVNELTVEIINSIKAAFKDKTINITVTDTVDETEYLLQSSANKDQLYKAMDDLEAGKGISFTMEELQRKYGGE